MLTVIETPVFQELAPDVWGQDEREEFAVFISENPESGAVIIGTGNLRKVRWKRGGIGKRGGARVIYYTRLPQGEVVLIAVYTKAKFDTIPNKILLQWKEAYDGQGN